MTTDIDSLAGKVGPTDDLSALHETLVRWVSEARLDDIFALASRLSQGADGKRRVRELATRLGSVARTATFLEAVGQLGKQDERLDLMACWAHELVLRGHGIDREPTVRAFRERLEEARHPLAVLPLVLQHVESEAPSYMPMFGDEALAQAVTLLESGSMSLRSVPPPPSEATSVATRVTTGAEPRALAPVATWKNREAVAFDLAPPVRPTALGRWLLRALGLTSLEATTSLEVTRMDGPQVFGSIFAAAANGGASGIGLGGAYGRHAAWTSLAAITGASEGATTAAVADRVERTTYLSFRGEGPFWFDVAWDIGILALRPDGASAFVLAASDTDE